MKRLVVEKTKQDGLSAEIIPAVYTPKTRDFILRDEVSASYSILHPLFLQAKPYH